VVTRSKVTRRCNNQAQKIQCAAANFDAVGPDAFFFQLNMVVSVPQLIIDRRFSNFVLLTSAKSRAKRCTGITYDKSG